MLERRDPIAVVRQQRLAEAERRQRDEHVLVLAVGTVQLERVAETRLQLVELVPGAVHRGSSVGPIGRPSTRTAPVSATSPRGRGHPAAAAPPWPRSRGARTGGGSARWWPRGTRHAIAVGSVERGSEQRRPDAASLVVRRHAEEVEVPAGLVRMRLAEQLHARHHAIDIDRRQSDERLTEGILVLGELLARRHPECRAHPVTGLEARAVTADGPGEDVEEPGQHRAAPFVVGVDPAEDGIVVEGTAERLDGSRVAADPDGGDLCGCGHARWARDPTSRREDSPSRPADTGGMLKAWWEGRSSTAVTPTWTGCST